MIDIPMLNETQFELAWRIIIILIVSYIIVFISRIATSRIKGKTKNAKARTVISIVDNTMSISVLIISVLTILSELKINIMPFLASAGIAGFAIGFGSQSLIKDFLTGIFLITNDTMREGDIVRINGIEGKVESISARATILRDLDGVTHTIPNGSITTVANLTKDWSRVNITFTFKADKPIDDLTQEVKNILSEIKQDKEWQRWILEEPKVELVDVQGGNISLRVLIKTKERTRWDLSNKVRYLIKKNAESEKFTLV